VEAGSNTSAVALRVVGGEEKGSIESETAKYGREPTGLGPENDYAGEDQQRGPERAPHINKPATLLQ
jgi:hypothetical protein